MFDGAPQVPKFIPGREGARQLATALREVLPFTQKFEWAFSIPISRYECGTIGCAMGYAATIWPDEFEQIIENNGHSQLADVMAKKLGMPYEVAYGIFYGLDPIYDSRGGPDDDITPVDVAQAIEAWLATDAD